MLAFFWIILFVFGGFGIFILCDKIKDNYFKSKYYSYIRISFNTLGTMCFLVIFLCPLYYEFPNFGSQVITFDNDKVTVHKFGTFVWEWDEFVNAPTSNEARHESVDGFGPGNIVSNSVTIRTENPKVRKISYSVIVYISDLESFYSSHSRRNNYSSGAQKMINRVVGEYLYDFNNNQSKNLEEFYNPLKAKQQEAFKRLLGQWMNERLKHTGIQVKVNPFQIDDMSIS